MDRALVDGVELAYELRGSGEAVVLVHWGVSAAWSEPLLEQPALAGRFRLLRYDRAGYGASGSPRALLGIADHARHCQLLMRHVGIESAHVVGHSSSAAIALQLALDAPHVVQSLALLEPARPTPDTERQRDFRERVVGPALARYRAGDPEGAVDAWARGVFGPGYRARLERWLPGAVARCLADADAFFAAELPALQAWSFGEDDARRIAAPALAVVGEETEPSFPERLALLASWLPSAEWVEVPGASHLLHFEDPPAVATALEAFFARHPIAG